MIKCLLSIVGSYFLPRNKAFACFVNFSLFMTENHLFLVVFVFIYEHIKGNYIHNGDGDVSSNKY